MTQNIDELFRKTKGQLFYRKGAGFLGRILAQVEFSWNVDIPTAAIGPDMLFWNPDFFLELTESTRVTVLGHELSHNGSLHGIRMGTRDPDLWNQAGDHMINLRLEEDGFDMTGFPYLMDRKYKSWATEDIYDDLVKQGSGKKEPNLYKLSGDILPVSKGDIPKAITKIVEAVTSARITGQAGDIPGEVTMVLDKFLNPKLPWETLFYNFFNQITNEERSFARPNRRYTDPILPGTTGHNGLEHLMHYQDISGSVTDGEILVFNSELKFIKEEFNPEKMTVTTFDTKLRDQYVFDKDDPFEEIIITGRGGTSLVKVMEDIKKHAPTAAVIFTDLEVHIPPNPGVPIIWICMNNKGKTVPYGTLIHIKD